MSGSNWAEEFAERQRANPNTMFNMPVIPQQGPDLVDTVEARMAARDRIAAAGGTPPPLTAYNDVPIYGYDGNRTAAEAMVQAGYTINHIMRFPLKLLQLLPGVGSMAALAAILPALIQEDYVGAGLDVLQLLGAANWC